MIASVRLRISREEFDYPALMSALADYASPRDKVTTLLKRGDIVRVKKGIYVFGEAWRRRPFSRELLANLIYGPSFVSLQWALAFHGLIPERVTVLSSVTCKRAKDFETPVGRFIYRPTPQVSFHRGMERIVDGDVAFLIASPERAVADTIREIRSHGLRTFEQAEHFLVDDLRLDHAGLDLDELEILGEALGSAKVKLGARTLRRLRR